MKYLSVNNIRNDSLLLSSVFLSIPTILFYDKILFVIPVLVLFIFSLIFGERFVISLIIISLFTLVRDVSGTYRIIVQVIDLSLLGYFFLNKYGLDFRLYPKLPKILVYFVILYFTAMFLSAMMSSYPFAGIGLILQQITFFIVVYFFYALIIDERNINDYVISIIIVACIIAISSLTAFMSGDTTLINLNSNVRERVTGLIGNLEASTTFSVIAFPMLLIWSGKKVDRIYRNLIIAAFILLGVSLILIMSRSAIMAIIFSTAVILFILKRELFYNFIFFLAIALIVYFLYEPLNSLLSLIFRIEEGLSARDKTWGMSLDIIRDHPVFGIGPGAYKYEMFKYFPFMLSDWWGQLFIYYYQVTEGANFAHNFFLFFFTDMGILGFLTAIFLPVIYFYIGIKTIKSYSSDSRDKYLLIVGLFAAGSSIILRNFFNSIGILFYGGITTDLPFWLIFSSLIYFYQSRPVLQTSKQT